VLRATPRTVREGPREEGGLGSRGETPRVLDTLLIPTDPRGIILLCGFVVAAVFGAMALLNPPGDPIGLVYIVVAVLGYFFIQTRGLTTFLWLLVAAGGAAVALAGNLLVGSSWHLASGWPG
jgi:hypothetical protein